VGLGFLFFTHLTKPPKTQHIAMFRYSDEEKMNKRIIYPTDGGGVAVIIPADCGLTIEEIAAKDVPTGKPYKIVDVTDIPSDRTFRNAWEYSA
jgi:hypothetical protein